MGTTGVFYHPSFSRRSYLTVGRRLAEFPRALEPLLARSHLLVCESPHVSDDLIRLVHDPGLIPEVEADPLWSTARASVGGVVEAMRRVAAGELANAFAFIGAGGHHAGRRSFGGYCCFNDVCIGIAAARRLGLAARVAILDTDAHHGDGTREIVEGDPATLHVCVCGTSYASRDGTKHDLAVAWDAAADPDAAYLAAVRPVFPALCRAFRPDLVVWYFGFDGHRGDYGDMGLGPACFRGLADLMVEAAAEAAGGRLVVVLGGGSRTDLATALIPPIIARLADAA